MPRQRSRGVGGGPAQPHGAAGHAPVGAGRLRPGHRDLARPELRAPPRRGCLPHHREVPPGRAPRAPGGAHPRQPAGPALPGPARGRPDRGAAAELGRPSRRVVPQPRHRGPRGDGRSPGAGVELQLLRVPREPAGEALRRLSAHLRHPLARLRHQLRALPRPRGEPRRPPARGGAPCSRARSCIRRPWTPHASR